MRSNFKRVSWMVGWVFISALFSYAWAAGLTLSGVGSKAIAMGGAFRGLADDYSAAYWNPAGLATQDGFEFSATGIAITSRLSLTPAVPIPGYTQETREAKRAWTLIPNGAFFTDVGRLSWLRFGVAGYVPAGLRTNIDLYDLPEDFGNTKTFPQYEWSSKLEVFDIHPALAASLFGERLNLGVGVGIQRASATLQRPTFQPTLTQVTLAQLSPELQAILGPVAQSAQGMMPIDTVMTGVGWGYGLNAGVLFKPLSTLNVGISGRTQTRLTLEGDASFTLYTPGNPQLAQTLQSLPVPALARLAALFSGQVISSEGTGTTELVLPADLGIGIAWRPFEALTLTGDATWTGWSAFEELRLTVEGVELLGQPITERVIPEKWEDVVRFSAGFELRPSRHLAIRGGYYLDPSPIPEKTQGPLIPDIGDKHSINVGLGLKLGALGLNVNYEMILWPDRQVRALDADGDGAPDSLPGEYAMRLHSLMSTWTLTF